jgi:flagellar hook-basal body complex protein FliE
MTVPIHSSTLTNITQPTLPGTTAGKSTAEVPFADLVKGLVQDASQQQSQMSDSVRQLVAGETDNIHEVVLTASRADLAFRLVMEVRNRMISSYEEIMRMQI